MKKIGIITLTRQNSLAYTALRRIVKKLGYEPICGKSIGADCIYFPLEEISLVGYDFLADFFKKVGFADADAILISAPYTINLFMLPKVIWCLRSISSAPIIVGGNEASNNYKNIMLYRFSTFVHQVVDIAPDFIVRGAAEKALYKLLPLLDKKTMTHRWNRRYFAQLVEIPNIVFWLPPRMALIATEFSSEELDQRDIFSYVKYGERSIAITLQRACIWAKKSRGGCLFCAIASQFGNDFHCAVKSDFFVEELSAFLKKNGQIKYIDVWDDTFNIDEAWALEITNYLKELNKRVKREIGYSVFLRPKGVSQKLVNAMTETNIQTAFIGADALTEELSQRLRRGCTVEGMNNTIEVLAKGKILPRLSVQLFSPESTVDDVGITTTLALGCIKNNESTVHVHLYTFPLYGSDIYRLLEARNNLKKIPSPLLRMNFGGGFEPYAIAYDYINYDPDVEDIKQRTYRLLNISASFHVRTYPGDKVDGRRLKETLSKVRQWCLEVKNTHQIKSTWLMIILFMEDQGKGLGRQELLNLLSKDEAVDQIPGHLAKVYGNFGYRFTLSRSFDEVMAILVNNKWVQTFEKVRFGLSPQGRKQLKSMISQIKSNDISIAAYGKIDKFELLKILSKASISR